MIAAGQEAGLFIVARPSGRDGWHGPGPRGGPAGPNGRVRPAPLVETLRPHSRRDSAAGRLRGSCGHFRLDSSRK